MKTIQNYIILILIVTIGCSSPQKKEEKQQNLPTTDSTAIKEKQTYLFPDLQEGEVTLDDNCFGELIELKGTQKITNEIFSIKESQMLVKDSLLLVKNLSFGKMFMAFSLPDFKLVKKFGKRGSGPGEFQNPSLVPTDDTDCLCYIQENVSNKLFRITNNLSIEEMPFSMAQAQTKRMYGDKQIHSFTAKDFAYVESIKQGKGLFRLSRDNDTTTVKMVQNLSFSDNHKSWASYIGDFGANNEKERMVFAYKYFKRITFIDSKTGKTRSLNFKVENAKKGNALSVMSPQNITHYWGMSAQKEHVYVLYSGRSPVDVQKERSKEHYYIFVEQFDWNGTPIAKYKLDNWGYFCADEKMNKFYIASTNHAEAFFEYEILKN